MPNGNDFWWDEFFASNTGNCWFDNTGADGTAASVTGPGDAGRLPGCRRTSLPSDCATSVGNGDIAKTPTWSSAPTAPTRTPARPTATGGRPRPRRAQPASAKERSTARRAAAGLLSSPESERLRQRIAELTG